MANHLGVTGTKRREKTAKLIAKPKRRCVKPGGEWLKWRGIPFRVKVEPTGGEKVRVTVEFLDDTKTVDGEYADT